MKQRWLPPVALVIIIFAAAFALYQSCFDNPFVLDDLTKIQQNPDMQVTSFSFENFMFSYPETTTQLRNDPSRPLTYIVFWACWQLGGGSPLPFHIVSTVAHASIAVLLALITAELTLQIFGTYSLIAGGIAALTFLTSPLMAGTVVYAYGLSDVLSGLFILLAYFLLIRPSSEVRSRRLLITAVSLVSFLLALAAKQSAVVIAPLVIVTDLATRRKNLKQRALEIYAPLIAVCFAYIAFRFFYFGAVGDLEGRGSTVKPLAYLLFQGAMILKYLKMTVIPTGFTIDHLYLPADLSTTLKLLAWAAVIALGALSTAALFKKDSTPTTRWLSLGWLFFLLCLLPTSSFLPTVDMFVERRAYMADLGLFMLFGGLVSIGLHGRRTQTALIAALLTAALAGQTYVSLRRSELYASTEELWKESLALDDLNLRARTNLAVHYSATKQYDKALAVLEELLKYDPNNGGTYSKIGYVYMQPDFKNYDEQKAWEYMEKSLKLLPDNIFALYNGGVILLKHGRFAESEKLLVHATELNPLMANAWLRAGEAAYFQQHTGEAIVRFRRALKLNSGQLDAKMYLSRLGVPEE